MMTLEITVPADWSKRWPCTRGVAGHLITVTYDEWGNTVDIEGDWPELTGEELGALEGATLEAWC